MSEYGYAINNMQRLFAAPSAKNDRHVNDKEKEPSIWGRRANCVCIPTLFR